MIGDGWIRAPLARWPIYPLAAAGVMATQVFLVSPAMSAQQTNPDARIGTRVSVNCGGGVFATNRRLPAGFSALTATRAQLIANDLPVRPTGPVRVAAWRSFVTGGVTAIPARCANIKVLGENRNIIGDARPKNIIGDAKPKNIIGDAKPKNIIGDVQPNNIIGDVQQKNIIGDSTAAGTPGATAGIPGAAVASSDVYATWRVPAAGKRATAGPTGLRAAGLTAGPGTSTAHPMVQAGSAATRSASGQVSYYLWWRVLPQQTDQRQISVRVHAGDSVYAHLLISHGVATVTIRDLSTGAGGTYLLHPAQLTRA